MGTGGDIFDYLLYTAYLFNIYSNHALWRIVIHRSVSGWETYWGVIFVHLLKIHPKSLFGETSWQFVWFEFYYICSISCDMSDTMWHIIMATYWQGCCLHHWSRTSRRRCQTSWWFPSVSATTASWRKPSMPMSYSASQSPRNRQRSVARQFVTCKPLLSFLKILVDMSV